MSAYSNTTVTPDGYANSSTTTTQYDTSSTAAPTAYSNTATTSSMAEPYADTTVQQTTTTATAVDVPAPSIPVRPIAAVTTPDIHTTYVGQPLESTSSFTTNTGAPAQAVLPGQGEPLVKPASGLVHMIKKAMTTGSGPNDPMLEHADATLRANMESTRRLQQQLQRYQQAQQALQDATVAVAQCFHSCLSDETNPYAPLSAELLAQSQQHTLVPAHSAALIEQANAAAADFDNGYQQIQHSVSSRKTKASDVEYYVTKVDKLTSDQEQQIAKGSVTEKSKEKLERNIGKTREIQLEYNAENERLIADMNALWRRRILQLGPALTRFISGNQLVYADHAQLYARMVSSAQQANPEYAHNTYLQSQQTMLMPTGAGYVDHRELINRSREVGLKSDVAMHQRQLQAETQQRQHQVGEHGGQLETVAMETIVRSEEQMRVLKERFVTERVRMRKVVTTEMVTMTVPVRKERIEVERVPVNGPMIPVTEAMSIEEASQRRSRKASRQQNANNNTAGGRAAQDVDDLEEEVFELVLSEERPRVVTDVVPIERVRMRKLRQVNTQNLEMDVRREQIDYAAPQLQPGQQQVVTQVGGIQTVVGNINDGFKDSTGNANVIVRHQQSVSQPGVVQETVSSDGVVQQSVQGQYVKADVDDVAAMSQIGASQRGQYSSVNTVGMVDSNFTADAAGIKSDPSLLSTGHPYGYSGTSAASVDSTSGTSYGSPYDTTRAGYSATSSSTSSTSAPTRPVV